MTSNNGEKFVKRIHLVLTIALMVVTIVGGIVTGALLIDRLQAKTLLHDSRIAETEKRIKQMETSLYEYRMMIYEVKINLKSLCDKMGVDYQSFDENGKAK